MRLANTCEGPRRESGWQSALGARRGLCGSGACICPHDIRVAECVCLAGCAQSIRHGEERVVRLTGAEALDYDTLEVNAATLVDVQLRQRGGDALAVTTEAPAMAGSHKAHDADGR